MPMYRAMIKGTVGGWRAVWGYLCSFPNMVKFQSKYSKTKTFKTFRWHHVGGLAVLSCPLCAVSVVAWFALLGQANMESSAEAGGFIQTPTCLFSKTPNIPVTACSCCLATGWVLREKRGVIDVCVYVYPPPSKHSLLPLARSPVSGSLSPQPHCHVMELSITHSEAWICWAAPSDSAHREERCFWSVIIDTFVYRLVFKVELQQLKDCNLFLTS